MMLPVAALLIWTISTLSWWAFAFMPLPSQPPEWLTAARYACFGSMETGLPGAEGWILLVIAPPTFLAPIFALWGAELRGTLRRLASRRAGQVACAAVAVVVLVEGAWVGGKLRTAQQVGSADASVAELPAELPRDYPRQTKAAPEFSLVDQHGQAVSLGRFKGRPVVVSFVFAHCQTMCPAIVETIKRATPGAGRSEVLLVTLDPWRDTVSTLPSIARQWDMPDNFHVLSAKRVDDVLKVVRAYEVPFERDEKTGDVTHAGLVFVVDPDGRLAYTFNNPPVGWVREALDRLGTSHRTAG